MLRLSRKVDYGLAFLAELAERPGEWVSLSQVAKQRGISQKFLSQLAVSLKGEGLVESREGLGGGYRLAKAPTAIRVKEVVKTLEGNTALVDCLVGDGGSCPVMGVCAQKSIWGGIQSKLDRLLEGFSVADLSTRGG